MLVSNGALAPTSFADTNPSVVNQNYYPTSGMSLVNQFATYGAIYRAQVTVASLVNKLAMNVARLPLKPYTKAAAGRQSADDTPYGKLLANPNSRHDAFYFWLWTWSTFEVYGEALWLKVRQTTDGPPVALIPIHPSNVFVRFARTADNRVTGGIEYVYHLGSAAEPVLVWPERDIVHFRSYNPENQQRGMSRLEPLRQSLLTDNAIRRAQEQWYKNGARPSAMLNHPTKLSDDSHARLKASWDAVHSGIDNWGKTVILEEGMTAQMLQLDAQQMDLIASLKLSREDACMIYDVPPTAVHVLDHATFTNITEQLRSIYRDTMAPRLHLIESVLDAQLRPEFGDSSLYAEFLLDDVLRGDFEARTTSYREGVIGGWLTPGEVRAMENLPDLGPDTHRLYVNSATIPLGSAAGGNPTGTEVEIKPQAIKSLAPSTVRSVMGRIGRSNALSDLDRDRLTVGLNGDTETVLAALDAADSIDDFRSTLKGLAQEAP